MALVEDCLTFTFLVFLSLLLKLVVVNVPAQFATPLEIKLD